MSWWVTFARISIFSSFSLLLLVLVSSWTWKLLLTRTQSMDCQVPSSLVWLLFFGTWRQTPCATEKALHIVLGGHSKRLNFFGFTHIPLIQRPTKRFLSKSNHLSSNICFVQETFPPVLFQHLVQETLKLTHTHISASPRRSPNHFVDQDTSNHPHDPQHECLTTDDNTSKRHTCSLPC